MVIETAYDVSGVSGVEVTVGGLAVRPQGGATLRELVVSGFEHASDRDEAMGFERCSPSCLVSYCVVLR